MKVLVDTSVWIDALNGQMTRQVRLLGQLLDEDAFIVLCPVIVQKILQGIKEDKDFELVKDNLSGFEMIVLDPLEAAYGAAALYRDARQRGITIRKSNDCLIAFYALSANASLLHNDEDFDRMVAFTNLRIL